MNIIKLEVTVDEANTILESLGAQPYKAVAEIIAKIQAQGSEQVKQDVSANEQKDGKKEAVPTPKKDSKKAKTTSE